jgi:hypothetical protein
MMINHPAVLASALIHRGLGALWYSPLLLTNKLISLMRWSPQDVEAARSEGAGEETSFALLGSLLLSYVLAHFIHRTKSRTAVGGTKSGFRLWSGVVATVSLKTVLFEGRALGLYLVKAAYRLVWLALTWALLAIWRRTGPDGPAN